MNWIKNIMVLAAAVIVTSCAQDVGDIDRTQPNLLPKSMFDGKWFVRQTITDVPPESGFSFVGLTGELDTIVWEIQEDYLVGYRAYQKNPGSDSNADQNSVGINEQDVRDGFGEGIDETVYKGSPIVMYPIVNHVDVQRNYNPATGEQTNVIVENMTDRPWRERDYIRVNWGSNQIANFFFLSNPLDQRVIQSDYVQEDQGGLDAFRAENENGERWNIKSGRDVDVNYFDFTEKLFVNPEFYSCIFSLYYNQLGDCASHEIKVRTSFLQVNKERENDYEPMLYDDKRHGEFGYFRTLRPTYDRLRGVTQKGVIRLANRHDIWRDIWDDKGTPETEDDTLKPLAERGLRPIVYTLSENYPQEMIKITTDPENDDCSKNRTNLSIAGQFDCAFKEVVAAGRQQTIAQLEQDLLDQTGNSCLYCVETNEDKHARIGDMRYSFIYWVDSVQLSSPLGYGPSDPNPETGRIISGNAYVYGASVDSYAQYAKDMVDLLNGDLTDSDIRGGDFIREEVDKRFNLNNPLDREFAKKSIEAFRIDAQKRRFPRDVGRHCEQRDRGSACAWSRARAPRSVQDTA